MLCVYDWGSVGVVRLTIARKAGASEQASSNNVGISNKKIRFEVADFVDDGGGDAHVVGFYDSY